MTILYKLTVCALQILVFSKPHLVYHYCLRARRSLGQNDKLGLYWSWLACVQFPCGYSCFVPHFKCVNSCLSLLALTGSAPLQPWIKLDGCFSELGDQSWYNIWLCTYTHTHTPLLHIGKWRLFHLRGIPLIWTTLQLTLLSLACAAFPWVLTATCFSFSLRFRIYFKILLFV